MKTTPRRPWALAMAVALVVLGCGQPAPPTTTSSPAAIIPLLTAEPVGEGTACMAALLQGDLALDPRSGLGVAAQGGPPVPVRWPNGWTAVDGTPPVLVDRDGRVVARVGDPISIGGGFGVEPTWFACDGDIKAGLR